MGTDIINKIESLNPRKFSDYEFLANDLRNVISNFDKANNIKLIEESNFEGYFFNINSIDYIKKIFNNKLQEFIKNFFWEDELIRGVVIQNPSILDTINVSDYKYFYPLTSQGIERLESGPTDFTKMQVSLKHFERNYKSGYYLSLKSNSAINSSKKQEGCFVATFAYDSYEHHNVLFLRDFRDNVLENSKFGRIFISTYYKFSPRIVLLLEKIKFPKSPIRLLLSCMILLISKRK